MNLRHLFVLLLNSGLLAVVWMLYKVAFHDVSLYSHGGNSAEKLDESISNGFQMLVQIYLAFLVFHLIYYVFYLLFLKRVQVLLRAALFAIITYLLLSVLMIAGAGSGLGHNFSVKLIPFAGLGFCLSVGEHWISRWAFKQNASNSERQ